MSDARLENVGFKCLYYRVPSKTKKYPVYNDEGEIIGYRAHLYTVSVHKETFDAKCECEHVPFLTREAGVRNKTDDQGRIVTDTEGRPVRFTVGEPGVCHHVKTAVKEARRMLGQ